MTDLVTAARMRAIEQDAIADGTVTGAALMARAVAGALGVIAQALPGPWRRPPRAIVLCGPGNNGGDGYGIACGLADRGWQVRVFALGDPDRLPPDARANRDAWAARGPVGALAGAAAAKIAGSGCDLLVDAVFGTGLTRPVDLPLSDLRDAAGTPCVVAIDMPSGLCSDSGRVLGGMALAADLTVTFHARKPGHVLATGPAHCGRVRVVDIGLRPAPDPRDVALIQPPDGVAKTTGHKYDHGHALIVTGGASRTGAARLAARAALRAGAGLVTLGAPGSAMLEVAAHIDAEMLRRIGDGDELRAFLADSRVSVVCLGPGLGLDRARALVPVALEATRVPARPVVLDADALTAFADAPDALFECTHRACVLTPHDGEFARLFPDIAAPLRDPATRGPAVSRIDAARAAAGRAGCVVLLKGPDTIIADPSGRAAVLASVGEHAVPGLATAGAGDVLAGLVAGLLARGLPAFEATAAASWLHAAAARALGPGVIAPDLPEALPQVLAALSPTRAATKDTSLRHAGGGRPDSPGRADRA